ncbi:hypothetical protein SLS64_004086 [Diaporthe eres]|uniref:Zn(2)-C6 fungal-type domain-containing protein n=1 Tax=Diaporthe eres TaxID=83184 RepID=A0ABR1PQP4_DIAER
MAHPEPLATDQHHKRKRDSDDNGQQSHDRIPQPPPPQSGNGAHINYLARSNSTRLKLIQGDGEVFSDVLGLIGDYEGVLSRHESLAANLGAKLTGPRLVKAMEGLFEGSITATRRDPYNSDTVTWLDIVQFAKASPNEFTLTTNPDRGRYCSFFLKGNQVEITEDDWRLIMSGTLDRFNLAPLQPLEEDENSELATLEIMEQRLQVLIKKADEVARKARQLNYHLSGRKAAINSRRTVRSPTTHQAGFQPVNHPQAVPRSNSTYDLHADLLQQFTSQSQPGSARIPAQNSISLPTTPVIQQQRSATAQSDDPSDTHRSLVTARIEKLAKGDTIHPPCDRCRRLRVQCIKHLTACQGCTKKHAKCGWKTISDDELNWLKREVGSGTSGATSGGEGDGTEGDDTSGRSGGGFSPDPPSLPPISATSATAPSSSSYGDRPLAVDTRAFAPVNHSNSVGSAKERGSVTDFGLRDHRPSSSQAEHRVDHYRLSHMANVALSADAREQHQHQQHHQHQQNHSQRPMMRGTSVPRD